MQVDNELSSIADYVCDHTISNQTALSTARYCILDAIGCAILALKFDNCTKLLGPIVPGTVVPGGVRVPGTSHVLDPVTAAFNIGTMVRWLDYNDTWLAAEWGHPSDNVGAILAVADYISQQRVAEGKEPLTMKTVMEALIKAYEIQGVLALENSLNQVGLDHVLFVKVASTALATHLLGGNKEQITAALSNAFIDGAALRTYRHAPNTGSRKSWAAGDATSRAVWHAFNAIKGEMGYPTALTARGWGFYDVLFRGNPFRFQRPYDEYVMENVFFKVAFPAEFHAQTAVECAFKLHPEVKDRLSEVAKVHIKTHKSAIRIIDKKGTLRNPADRDHCLQYMVAVALIYGHLTADHYEDDVALSDLRIDELREKMIVTEDVSYSQDYLDPNKRSIANGLQIEFTDGTKTDFVEIHFPIGHRRRREEAIPLIEKKFQQNIASHFNEQHVKDICRVCLDADTFENTPVSDFVTLFLPNN